LISNSDQPLAAMHAIWVLKGIGAPAGSEAHRILTTALTSSQPLIRRHAMLALSAADPAVLAALPSLLEQATNPREKLYVLTTAALALPDRELSSALCEHSSDAAAMDATLQQALQLALRRQGVMLFSEDFSGFKADAPTTWFEKEILAIISRTAAGPARQALVSSSSSAPAGLKAHIERILAAPPEIDRTPIETPPRFVAGRDLYMKSCIECHQADGRGVPNTFPPIAGSEWLKGDRATTLRLVLGGLAGPIEVNGQKFNGVMPGHSHMKDDELAKIISFVRFSFGGLKEKPISPEEVKAQRPAVENRKYVPWTVDELKEAAK
jgi:mono/diheme cytochrome c family protein